MEEKIQELSSDPQVGARFRQRLSAELEAPLVIPDAPLGTRRILHAKSGSFSGPGLQGEVLPGGGDWVLDRRDGRHCTDAA